MASTESTILSAIESTINGLTFTVDPEEIAIRKWPYDKGRDSNHWYPGVTIHRLPDDEMNGTNERDDVVYNVGVTMVVDNSADPTEDDIQAEWQQTIRKAFIHQRLSGVTCVCTCLIAPGPEYRNVPENYDVSSLTVRVVSRETRT